MDNKSPFGNVCGLRVVGSANPVSRVVQLAIYLLTDSGLNIKHVTPNAVHAGKVIEWGGTGDMCYSARMDDGSIVDVSLAYMHDEANVCLLVSFVVTFNPHGWITLPDHVVSLDRIETLEFGIPQDIVEEHLSAVKAVPLNTVNLENVYGQRLSAESRDTILARSTTFRPRKRERLDNAATADFHMVSIEEYNSLSRQRELQHAADERTAESLRPLWEADLRAFISGLLGNSARTRDLIHRWHARVPPPALKAVPSRSFSAFIEGLLFSEFALVLTDAHIQFFSDPELAIPLTWLTTSEKIFCNRLYVNRSTLFMSITTGGQYDVTRQYSLSRFRLDKLVVVSSSFCPRFIVHQFAMDCIEYALRRKRPAVLLTLISAVGQCYARRPRDVFLMRLKLALEKPSFSTAVAEMGMFVRIGLAPSAKPEYEIERNDNNNNNNRGNNYAYNRAQSTPYRLVN